MVPDKEHLDNSLKDYYLLQKDLIASLKKIDSCKCVDQKEVYQDVALCYSKHIYEAKKYLKINYGLHL